MDIQSLDTISISSYEKNLSILQMNVYNQNLNEKFSYKIINGISYLVNEKFLYNVIDTRLKCVVYALDNLNDCNDIKNNLNNIHNIMVKNDEVYNELFEGIIEPYKVFNINI